MNDIIDFLVKANRAGYADENASVTNHPDGMHEITFEDDGKKFVDTWWGGDPFSGQEHIELQGKTIWAMQYRGGMTEGNVQRAAQTFKFLKQALSLCSTEEPLRGPAEFTDGEWRYENKWSHDIENFSGHEKIWHAGILLHTCDYFGGVVDVEEGV